MTIKAIMVDVDGVLIVHPDERGWSANLERDIGIPAATLQTAFFEQHWDDVVLGARRCASVSPRCCKTYRPT